MNSEHVMTRWLTLFLFPVLVVVAGAGYAQGTLGDRFRPMPGLHGSADRFGNAVAVAADVVVVGALDEGAAYLYERSGDNWPLAVRLSVPGLTADAWFGASVAIDADTVAVGAWGGDEVFMFERAASGWLLAARLRGRDTSPGDRFGSSLALDGGLLVVGAVGRQGGSGAAYLFGRGADGWTELSYLDPPDAVSGGRFAASMALRGDLLAVGESSASPGTAASGEVHLYRLAGGHPEHEATLRPSSGEAAFRFGASLALGDDLLAVGAPGDDYGGYPSGPVHLYLHGSQGWELLTALAPDGLAATTRFGVSLAAGPDYVAVAGYTDNDFPDGETLLFLFEGGESGWHGGSRVSLASSGVRYAAIASDASTLVVGVGGTDANRETILLYAIE